MNVNMVYRDRQILPSSYSSGGAPSQPPQTNNNPLAPSGTAPPMGGAYGSQQGYVGAINPPKPILGPQPPYGSTTAYGQPNMTQPQYGALPPQQQQQQQQSYMPQPQQAYSSQPGGFQQAGGPVPLGYQAGGPSPMGGFQQAGGPPMGGFQQAGGPPMGGFQQAGRPPMGGGFQQAGGPPMGGYQQAGGPSMGMGMGMGQGGAVSLVKGGNMSLSKAVPNLRHITVGLGWDVRQTPGAPFDLDATVFMLKGDGRVRMPQDMVFYNNRQSLDGSVYHHGDNLTGQGEGDDEQISVDLTRVPADIMKIVCVVSIYEAEARMQNFGMVNQAFIRVVNAENGMEIVRFDLTEEASMFNCMVFGELYRYNNEWKFRAIGQGVPGGLRACGPMFGIAMQ